MGKGSAIKLRGKELSIEGTLNLENMTIEIEEFSQSVEFKKLLELADLNGVFVKIKVTEADSPITESEIN